MRLPHGEAARQERIELRASGIVRGAWWAEESDETDINSGEAEEIEAARALAKSYASAESGRTFPHGVSCIDCLAASRCNECGKDLERRDRCTNARCPGCCSSSCRHVR